MSIRSLLDRLNHAPIWHRRITIGQDRFQACSFDRLLYLLYHRRNQPRSAEVQYLRGLILPSDHVIDAGANLGVFSHLMARAAGPGGRVTSFEPDPVLHAALVNNARMNGLPIRALPVALGAASASANLNRGLYNSGDNRLSYSPKQSSGGQVAVEVSALDDILQGDRVDLIKIDVQGWEVAALQGMEKTLKLNPAVRLFLELWPYGLKAAGTSAFQLMDRLRTLGFELSSIPGQPALESLDFAALEDQPFWFGDIVAHRPETGPAVRPSQFASR
jgi:FkbM family methyltransferase